ncbi:MAG: cobalamin biosynthesis protein CobD [Candidatus Rokubacteria bacterium]|nr:cobalamin biosynthesis protein CobD [Candidatus Rokubacteria bacterium]
MLLGAVALDLAFGDPPNRWHPVAWIGGVIAAGRRRFTEALTSNIHLVIAGGGLTVMIAVAAALAAWLIELLARSIGPAGLALECVALWTLFSIRGVVRAAREVGTNLTAGDLAGARAAVGLHLVSRPTAELHEGQVASAAIESVAENLADSVLAPLCFYLAFGLAGAAFYRVINTADAMIGYRVGVLEHFGKVAARIDDVSNLIPSRLAGLAIALASVRRAHAWRTMWHHARRTASPNAGWPMAAMAGALAVRLEKPGTYELGQGALPTAADVERSLAIFARAAAIGVALAVFLRGVAQLLGIMTFIAATG